MDAARTDPIHDVATASVLGVLVDLDGTLVPIASSPEQARADADVIEILTALARAPRTRVVVVSGRPRASLEAQVGAAPGVWLVAEHGAWRRDDRGWHPLALSGTPPDGIEASLTALAASHPGALVERKTWSVCLHHRRVRRSSREALVIEAMHAVEAWIAEHPEYELLEADAALEVRHRGAHKGRAAEWLRERLDGGARLLALGDDFTDEDTFAALGPDDASILVGPRERPTRAGARLDTPDEVRSFLRWLASVRAGAAETPAPTLPRPISALATAAEAALIAVSNRMPSIEAAGDSERARNVGGLVAALEPSLAAREGLWLGWSGRARSGTREIAIDRRASPARASFDLEPRWLDLYYNGFSNRSLWPLFHSLPGRARYFDDEWAAYCEVNELFAAAAARLAAPGATIWVHDYHLLLTGAGLRRRGAGARLGFFLHVPFPPLDLFETIPWARELIEGLLAFDLVGFHTARYAANFVACACAIGGAEAIVGGVRIGDRVVRAGRFPLGIDPAPFEEPEGDEHGDDEIAQLHAALGDRKLVLGVDRLDYTKGIPERLAAFARMLEMSPEHHGEVSLVQVAVPSRSDVPEYAEQRRAIEALVGHINGEHGEAHWVPVRYVYRAYSRAHLARLYRAAHVGLVTPLRDGMNLVAKEYVAAQDPRDPGVLLLSRFAGAAEEMRDALLTNPYHRDGMARDIARALAMPLEERIARHTKLLAGVHATTSASWASSFLSELER